MSRAHDVIDLADDDDDCNEDYDSIPLPDDIEALENAAAGPSRSRSNGSIARLAAESGDVDQRQSLKEELARLDAEVCGSESGQTPAEPGSLQALRTISPSCRNCDVT